VTELNTAVGENGRACEGHATQITCVAAPGCTDYRRESPAHLEPYVDSIKLATCCCSRSAQDMGTDAKAGCCLLHAEGTRISTAAASWNAL
jgi:hypothetical protein